MISDITIKASPRDGVGKGYARRLRAAGMIPASVYGDGQESIAVAVNAKEIAAILRSETGHNTIFNLALTGNGNSEPATVIIKDFQVDPVKGRLLHADLMRLSLTTATHVKVSIQVVGDPLGVKTEGGILELQLREVDIECLPGDIPDHIKVDVSDLHVGGHVTVADLIYDRAKIKVLNDEHLIVAGVLAPRLAEEAAPAPAEAAPETEAEPEVIKKGKTEEE
ncbi:MAG TPA: 50S ribosomal protein L25 [Blastocatellia bacterium]|nr:50S ribosomal protein L25 [Blastocatellia bacterium]